MTITALDLFAGSGWGVACQWLGIEEFGVEIMPEARATREAAGMSTVFADVWDGLADPNLVPAYDLLIASPPCQTFSLAGKGAGRQALDDVLRLIHSDAWALQGTALRDAAREAGLDDRTALVLSPLAYVAYSGPTFVVLEQVPTVLPVWEAVGEVMRGLGYSVAVGVLNAEEYGVPQTRKRAILVARRDGQEARLPDPTHSHYYPKEPKRLDAGLLPWVSMAEALGWDPTELVGFPRADDGREAVTIGGVAYRARDLRLACDPSQTVTEKARSWSRFPAWSFERPATTIAGDARVWPPGHKVNADDLRRLGEEAARARYGDRAGTGAYRMTVQEAAQLQTFPAEFPFSGSASRRFLQIGNAVPPLLAKAILETLA